MKLNEFEYTLPSGLIAQHPLPKRDQARLMVVDRCTQRIVHARFFELDQFLPKKSLLVLNESKVIPARLLGTREKTGGKVEIFLLNRLADDYSYEALIRPLKRLAVDERIVFAGSPLRAQLKDPLKKIVRFNRKSLGPYLEKLGHMPLPPYIKRPDTTEDREHYQTVYAKKEGSVAAPTAGLHFTEPLLKGLRAQGHSIEKVTLHINYATFKMVQEEDIRRHVMHEESYSVSSSAWKAVESAPKNRRKIVAVGTTSCRVLETLGVRMGSSRAPLQGKTNIFIYPGYAFKLTDILITNFHLPKSTLLMLVYAFGGVDLMKRVYQEAIKAKYRFYSYGDAMVIL